MMYMAGALLEMMNLETTREFTLERNIRNMIVVRNSANVVSGTKPLVFVPLRYKGLIIQRIHAV